MTKGTGVELFSKENGMIAIDIDSGTFCSVWFVQVASKLVWA